MTEKSMWEKTKEQAAKAADATKRATQKLTHQAIIANNKRRIHDAKRRYGVGIFDAFDDEDHVFAQQLFLDLRERVAKFEQDIVDREKKIVSECDPKYVPLFVPTSIASHEDAKQNYGNYHKQKEGSTTPSATPGSPKAEAKGETKSPPTPVVIEPTGSPELQHAKKPAMSTDRRGKTVLTKAQLLQWAQTTLEGYNAISIVDLDKSWSNGLGFAALVCHYEPQLVTLSALDPAKPVPTLKVAFDAAESCGVAVLLDPEDVAEADDKSLTSAITMYHKALSTRTPSTTGQGLWNARFK